MVEAFADCRDSILLYMHGRSSGRGHSMASLSNGSAAASSYDGGNHYPLNVTVTVKVSSRAATVAPVVGDRIHGPSPCTMQRTEMRKSSMDIDLYSCLFSGSYTSRLLTMQSRQREQTKTTREAGRERRTKRRKRRTEEQSRHSGEREEGRQGGSGEGWVRDGTGINIDKANKLKGARGSTACTGSERLSK